MPQKILPVSESTMRGEIDCRFSEAPIAAPTRFAARSKAVCVWFGVRSVQCLVYHIWCMMLYNIRSVIFGCEMTEAQYLAYCMAFDTWCMDIWYITRHLIPDVCYSLHDIWSIIPDI